MTSARRTYRNGSVSGSVRVRPAPRAHVHTNKSSILRGRPTRLQYRVQVSGAAEKKKELNKERRRARVHPCGARTRSRARAPTPRGPSYSTGGVRQRCVRVLSKSRAKRSHGGALSPRPAASNLTYKYTHRRLVNFGSMRKAKSRTGDCSGPSHPANGTRGQGANQGIAPAHLKHGAPTAPPLSFGKPSSERRDATSHDVETNQAGEVLTPCGAPSVDERSADDRTAHMVRFKASLYLLSCLDVYALNSDKARLVFRTIDNN